MAPLLYRAVKDHRYKDNIVRVRQLIASGEDVNGKNGDGWTPLMKAVDHCMLDILDILLESGADVNESHETLGVTALHLAAAQGDDEIVRRLLQAAASTTIKSKCGIDKSTRLWSEDMPHNITAGYAAALCGFHDVAKLIQENEFVRQQHQQQQQQQLWQEKNSYYSAALFSPAAIERMRSDRKILPGLVNSLARLADASRKSFARNGGGDVAAGGSTRAEAILPPPESFDDQSGGGDDLIRLVDYFVKEFWGRHKKDIQDNKLALLRISKECERIKRVFAANASLSQTSIELDSLFQGIDFYWCISRADFARIRSPTLGVSPANEGVGGRPNASFARVAAAGAAKAGAASAPPKPSQGGPPADTKRPRQGGATPRSEQPACAGLPKLVSMLSMTETFRKNLEQLQDTLECPICMEMPFEPIQIFQCKAGHVICSVCLDKMKECPSCRVKLVGNNITRNKKVEEIIKNLYKFEET